MPHRIPCRRVPLSAWPGVLGWCWVWGCAAEPAPQPGRDLHAEVETLIASRCAFSRCHGGITAGGLLSFEPHAAFRERLVDVPACEYDRMLRVAPFEPDHSWLMVKLTADVHEAPSPYAGHIAFTPEAGWRALAPECAFEASDGTALFGHRMPATAPNRLSDEDLARVRDWISAGAPGPKQRATTDP